MATHKKYPDELRERAVRMVFGDVGSLGAGAGSQVPG
jgi:hypothetical protein